MSKKLIRQTNRIQNAFKSFLRDDKEKYTFLGCVNQLIKIAY
jgi:hypothetical protein